MTSKRNTAPCQFTLRTLKAAVTYIRRRDRTENPTGKFDNAGRWYPKDRDAEAFDYSVRTPSRAWPYSYLVACRTAKHVARLFGVDEREVKRAARRLDALRAA